MLLLKILAISTLPRTKHGALLRICNKVAARTSDQDNTHMEIGKRISKEHLIAIIPSRQRRKIWDQTKNTKLQEHVCRAPSQYTKCVFGRTSESNHPKLSSSS